MVANRAKFIHSKTPQICLCHYRPTLLYVHKHPHVHAHTCIHTHLSIASINCNSRNICQRKIHSPLRRAGYEENLEKKEKILLKWGSEINKFQKVIENFCG